MKRATALFLCLLIFAVVTAPSLSNSISSQETFKSFWVKFKTAVLAGDKEAVATMSRFPIGMSFGIRSIRNKPELMRRYREVFSQQTNAAQCFAKNVPVKDETNARRFSIACPDEAGNEVVVYQFELTKTGWKFISLDNLNE